MRKALGAIVLALGAAAQPAFAGVGAAPPPGGAAPLPIITAAAPAVAASIVPGLATSIAVSPALTAVTASASAPSFRLASVSLPATVAQPIEASERMLRRRFTGSMMEFYPFAGSGFHLSGGNRLFSRRNFIQETENSARGALSVSRSIMAPIATKAGFKRFNPALTAGYTVAVSQLAQIGIEGGALMSHVFANTPGLPHHAFGYRNDHDFHPDAVANLVFGLHF